MVKFAPARRTHLPSAKRPRRIFGPCKSSRMPTGQPVADSASRIVRMRAACCCHCPCEALRRMICAPARISARTVSGASVAGPRVATIFALAIHHHDKRLPRCATMAFLNDYFLSTILGIIEGLTEFLPVSSTAHLRIAEAILGVNLDNGYWKMFSIVIQLGPILCLPIYFWSRIRNFLVTYPRGSKGDKTAVTHPLALTLAAFVVT